MELGLGGYVPLETWAAVAATLGVDLFTSERIREPCGRAAVIDAARDGGWVPATLATCRSAMGFGCLILERAPRRVRGPIRDRLVGGERLAVTLVDVVAGMDEVLAASETAATIAHRALPDGWVVGELVVVRRVTSNRRRLSESRRYVYQEFPTSGSGWIGAVRHPDHPVPAGRGLVWVDSRGTRLIPMGLRLRKA